MNKIKRPRDEKIANDRAERVRNLREALRYSRSEFCKKFAKYGLKANTLQSWETVRWNGLSEGGAEILVKIFQEENLAVTVEWLLFGIGEDPLKNIYPFKTASAIAKISTDETVTQELRFFHQINQDAVDAVITDDGLAPWLMPGDRVAGKRLFDNAMEKAIGHPCIVQTLAGNVLIRLLKSGRDVEYYTLACTNPDTTVKDSTIEDVKLFSAAPILWIRKPELVT